MLITGCAGFVGSNLCNHLQRDFVGVDNLKFGYRDNLLSKVKWIESDFEKIDLSSYNTLVHLACANIIYAQENMIDTFRINALNTIDLFSRFKGKIIYTSTSSVYGNAESYPTNEHSPTRVSNAYDQSKLIAEKYLQLRGNYTTLRLSNVYGPNQREDHPYSGVIGKFIGQMKRNQTVSIYAKGISTRDYTYVKDVVRAIEICIDLPALNTEINIGTGIETDSLDLAHLIANLMSKPLNIKYEPPRKIDTISRRCLDISKAKKFLNWEPEYNLEKGIKEFLSFC